jgi:TolB-like protein
MATVLASTAFAQAPPAQPASSQKPAPVKTQTKSKTLPTLIVFDLIPEKGVEKGATNLLTEIVMDRISATRRYTVVGQKDLDKMLFWEQNKQLKGCTDTSCLVQIAGAMGAEFYVEGSAGIMGSQYIITLKLIDAMSVKVVERTTEKAARDEDVLVKAVERMVDRIISAHAAVGPHGTTWNAAVAATDRTAADPAVLKNTGIGLTFSGVGIAAIGGVMTFLASKAADDYRTATTPKGMGDADGRRGNYNGAAIGMYAVGGAAAVTGVVLWCVGAAGKTKTAVVVPVVDRNGAYLSAAWEW